MEYSLLVEHWAAIVRRFKDSEKEFGHSAYDTERLARAVLDFIRYTRIRQFNLFVQQRGEEYERMLAMLEAEFKDLDWIQRMLGDEEFWSTTLEVGEQ